MGLQGTLADLGAVELVQYPHRSRRTGKLVVASESGVCELFYAEGSLVHAVAGTSVGLEALVELFGWKQGEFEFRQDVQAAQHSIELDLHHALMEAVRLRDEKAVQEAAEAPNPADAEEVRRHLETVLRDHPAIVHATVIAASGDAVAEAGAGEELPRRLVELLRQIHETYPRPGLRRLFFEDGAGIVLVQGLPEGRSLVVTTGDGTSAGTASIQAGRLAQSLLEWRG